MKNKDTKDKPCPWCTICKFCGYSVPISSGNKQGNHEYCEEKEYGEAEQWRAHPVGIGTFRKDLGVRLSFSPPDQ